MITAADIAGRRAACAAQPSGIPSGEQRSQEFRAQMGATLIEKDGKQFYELVGYASTVDQPYVMYDAFGEYDEVVDGGAFDVTLRNNPDVAYLVNHRGLTMARTRSGTLELGADQVGLLTRALVNPKRQDVSDLVIAIDDGDVDQMSFAFKIVRGQWSPDYTEYRILEVDLDRGDVSAVNYGANPNTSVAVRTREALAAVDDMPEPALRALVARGQARLLGDVDAQPDRTVDEDEHGPIEHAAAGGRDKRTLELLFGAGAI